MSRANESGTEFVTKHFYSALATMVGMAFLLPAHSKQRGIKKRGK
jgi:hypothetical protein